MDDLISRQAAIDALEKDMASIDQIIKGMSAMDVRLDAYVSQRNQVVYDIDAITQLPPIQPEPHWIPVTERVPEYGTEVVTYNRDEEFEINHIIDGEDGEWFLNGAIAWMPLPEPYKGVTT